MRKNKISQWFGILLKLALVFPSVAGLIVNIPTLIKHEMHIAQKSLINVLILTIIAASLLTTLWLCILGFLFLFVYPLCQSLFCSLGIIFLVNVVVLLIVGFIISKIKKNIFFPSTRKQLQHIKNQFTAD